MAALLDRAERQVERRARRIETLKARVELNAGRLSVAADNNHHNTNTNDNNDNNKKVNTNDNDGDREASLRAKVVRQRKEALKYSVERLELEVLQKERELRMRLDKAA